MRISVIILAVAVFAVMLTTIYAASASGGGEPQAVELTDESPRACWYFERSAGHPDVGPMECPPDGPDVILYPGDSYTSCSMELSDGQGGVVDLGPCFEGLEQ